MSLIECLRCHRSSLRGTWESCIGWAVITLDGSRNHMVIVSSDNVSIHQGRWTHSFVGSRGILGGLCPDCYLTDDQIRNTDNGDQ